MKTQGRGYSMAIVSKYKKNLEDATNDIARSQELQEALVSWKTSESNIVSPTLYILLDKYWLIDDDLGKIWKTIKKRNATAAAQAKPERDETVILQSRYGTLPKLEIGISKKVNVTEVWRRVSGGEHVYAVWWENTSNDSNNRGIGKLRVAFQTGGGTSGGELPVYEYNPVSYDEYYEMWRTGGAKGRKGTKSPGAMVYRVFRNRNYKHVSQGLQRGEAV